MYRHAMTKKQQNKRKVNLPRKIDTIHVRENESCDAKSGSRLVHFISDLQMNLSY